MLLEVPGQCHRANVLPMVCMRPRDGSPARALLSVRLIAFGFPPDSLCIWRSTRGSRFAGRPSIRSACRARPLQRCTPAPTLATVLAVNDDVAFCAAACACDIPMPMPFMMCLPASIAHCGGDLIPRNDRIFPGMPLMKFHTDPMTLDMPDSSPSMTPLPQEVRTDPAAPSAEVILPRSPLKKLTTEAMPFETREIVFAQIWFQTPAMPDAALFIALTAPARRFPNQPMTEPTALAAREIVFAHRVFQMLVTWPLIAFHAVCAPARRFVNQVMTSLTPLAARLTVLFHSVFQMPVTWARVVLKLPVTNLPMLSAIPATCARVTSNEAARKCPRSAH